MVQIMTNNTQMNGNPNDKELLNEEFLRSVGERVKKTRNERKLTRKTLSENSGVSERYLALLESGKGNVSIALLRQLSHSLGVEPESLISSSPYIDSDSRLVLGLLSSLNKHERLKLKDKILSEFRASPSARSYRIALTGLRGAGKTTVGNYLSSTLDIPFIELDKEVERFAGESLAEIFMTYGQEGFRNLERSCLENILAQGKNCIIATGGGIVQEPSIYNLLLSTCYTVWLKASPREHMDRVIAQGDMRPMAGNDRAMEQLKTILTNRQSSYEKADLTINTDGKVPDLVARQIIANPILKNLIQKTA